MDIGRFASPPDGSLDSKVMLEHELQGIYESEINVRIGWLWDGGIDVRLGDEVNGYLAEENVSSMGDIVPWLQEAIAYFYPHSTSAKSLDPQTRERAARRLFRSPISGAQVRCPDCGAPHAAPPGMEEVFAFVCAHCGKGVEVPRPKADVSVAWMETSCYVWLADCFEIARNDAGTA
jgi:hypothetical protein